MSQCEAAKAPPVETKHLNTHREIQRLDGVCKSLYELIERIQGPSQTTEAGNAREKEKDEQPPSLYEFLNGAPEAIESKINQMHDQIGEIHNLLF